VVILGRHIAAESLNLAENGSETNLPTFDAGPVNPDTSHHLVGFETNEAECSIGPSIYTRWRIPSQLKIDIVNVEGKLSIEVVPAYSWSWTLGLTRSNI
jgi:hypothetical protein